jgi:hypothetical protein
VSCMKTEQLTLWLQDVATALRGIWNHYVPTKPVPVVARSKAYVYGRSPAVIVGSNPTGAWMFICCLRCVLSGRGLCDELITRLEESYRLWCVVVCDQGTSWTRRP